MAFGLGLIGPDMHVDVERGSAEHEVAGFEHPELVARGFEARGDAIGIEWIGAHDDVDDRFRSEARDARGPDVFDERCVGEGGGDAGPFVNEALRPGGVVFVDLDGSGFRPADQPSLFSLRPPHTVDRTALSQPTAPATFVHFSDPWVSFLHESRVGKRAGRLRRVSLDGDRWDARGVGWGRDV